MTIRIVLSTLVISVLVSMAVIAQQNASETTAVRKAIEDHYFKAHATGDGNALKGYFVEEGRMMWVQDGQLRVRTSTDYVSGFSGKPPADEAKRQRRIVMTDVTGDVAIAKVELDYPGTFFTDYFTLARLEGEWKIIHKTYHRRARYPGIRSRAAGRGRSLGHPAQRGSVCPTAA
jgi:hypothetical protein